MSNKQYDVIIIGGSYAGLSAAMALGRSLRKVLVIDNWEACNRKTPHSHNFLTNDGETPAAIAFKARQQLAVYKTVELIADTVNKVLSTDPNFEIHTTNSKTYSCKKLLFATGLKDIMPAIPGFADCWGISIIHCPYCHGYEVARKKLAVFGNGDEGFEFAKQISNWSNHVTLFTNSTSTLSHGQQQKLLNHNINVIQTEVKAIKSSRGEVSAIILVDDIHYNVDAIFARVPFIQHTALLEQLGCKLTPGGHILIDNFCATTMPGVYAAGDNSSPMRGVANAVAAGTMAGVAINKALIEEEF